ncbi:MucR family transcriptional regulator [Pseudorhizobium flavum]|jgi:predicted transcriptional regulator|uniref:Putative transcriptional regulator n=1 Tax=Pseudorhizobium flavum TaxID=1335061 RepID=A0A7X0DAS9_9HYPH|nr:putative transcriptional regulator [Pseudorhizobium flavum]
MLTSSGFLEDGLTARQALRIFARCFLPDYGQLHPLDSKDCGYKERELSNSDTNTDTVDLLGLTTDIVSSYVSKNVVPAADLPKLIQAVHSSLTGLGITAEEVKTAAPEPAVPIKKSIKPDAITCLECGKGFKSLRRHLNTHHDKTPDEYRAKWSLPADYPMVAPEYSEARSSLAKTMGLGQRRAKANKKRKSA